MRKISLLIFLMAVVAVMPIWSKVYSRIGAKPESGWDGKYLIVYESGNTAYVWDATDDSQNYTEVAINNGKITSDDLDKYMVTVAAEGRNYSVKAPDGYIWVEAKKNGIEFARGAHECTIKENGGYVILETNTNTCRFVYNSRANRFRFYYDENKKWASNDYHNIRFYVEGDQDPEPSGQTLNLNYAHASMYACDSKFPSKSDPYNQYFYTELFLAQEESYDAVPQVGLEILAPTQYSLVGEKSDQKCTYRSDYTAAKKGYINITNGAHHSYYWFPSKAEAGYSEAAITVAQMEITKVGPSTLPNAYVYHIKLEFTDSNKKIWTLDKDMDVYGWWSDCDRSGKELKDMEPVAFTLESGNHDTETALREVESQKSKVESQKSKVVCNGRVYIEYEGKIYNVLGVQVSDF